MLQGYGSEVSQVQVNAEVEALIELYGVQALELPTEILANLIVNNRDNNDNASQDNNYTIPDELW